MSAHCDTCGADLAYDLSCDRCEWKERAEAAEAERDTSRMEVASLLRRLETTEAELNAYASTYREQAFTKWQAAEARVKELEVALKLVADERLRSMPGINPDGSVSTSTMAETLARAALRSSAAAEEGEG